MNELNQKIEALEKQKKIKAEEQRLKEEEERRKQEQVSQGHKNFLGNIKSFNVDDI